MMGTDQMTTSTKPKVIDSLTQVLPMLDKGKAQIVRCHQKGQKDMALLPYKALEPVLHKVITDFGALVALRYDLLQRMLDEAKVRMKSVVLNLDAQPKRSKTSRPKKARKTKKTAKSKTTKRTKKVKKLAKAKASKAKKTNKTKRTVKAKKTRKGKKQTKARRRK